MISLTMQSGGQLTLPPQLCERYGLTPATSIRIVETRTGLLLVPLTDEPMDPELARELAEWQEMSLDSWAAFPYEEDAS